MESDDCGFSRWRSWSGKLATLHTWLQLMLVTNPKARATAAQSACHPFLEPMDEEVVEKEALDEVLSSYVSLVV